MSSSRIAAPQKAVVQRRYLTQDEACEQAIKLLLARAVGVSSSNGDDTKGRSVDDFRAETSIQE
jgi:hypothetical protein